MLILFSLLLYVALTHYVEKQDVLTVFIISGLVCLIALAYPSALIILIPTVVTIWQYAKNKRRDTIILLGADILLGGGYVGYFVIQYGIDGLFSRIRFILGAEGKHNASSFFLGYKEFLLALLWMGIVVLISFLISRMLKVQPMIVMGILVIVSDIILCVLLDDLAKTWKFCFEITFFMAFIYGLWVLKSKWKEDTWQVRSSRILMMLAAADFIAVRLLTNWAYITLCGYLILGVVGVILLIDDKGEDESNLAWVYAIVLLVGVHRLFIFTDYSMSTTLSMKVNTYVKTGPAKGIIETYIRPYQDKCDVEDFKQYIQPGSNLLVVSGGNLNSLDYMLQPANVCTPSTISLPTYDENLLSYWEMHKGKIPDVIAVDCWYGTLNVAGDSWIMQWVEANYPNFEDGRYYRFYHR